VLPPGDEHDGMRTADHADTAHAGLWPGAHSGLWSLRLITPAASATVSSMVAVAGGWRGGSAGRTHLGEEGATPQ
jgi:hypothetical protein